MSTLSDQLGIVQERIAAAAKRSKRDPADVTLIAVTKTHPADTVIEAFELGLRHFGENRVEEAAQKISEVQAVLGVRSDEIVWHMIGHVQSRKAQDVMRWFERVHSLDSLKLARRLSRFAGEQSRELKVLLEFNLSGEASKSGFRPGIALEEDAALLQEVKEIVALPHLQIDGVMTMAAIVDDAEGARSTFRHLRELRDQLQGQFPQCDWSQLSMGMSDDFEVAIEEGATLVRLGRVLFGERLA